MRFLILGRSVGRIEKKNVKKSWNRRPRFPSTTLKVTIQFFTDFDQQNAQYTVKNFRVVVPVFLYAVTMLIF